MKSHHVVARADAMKPLVSVNHLAYQLRISPQRLREIANEIDADKLSHYRRKSEPYKNDPNKFRHFWVPKTELGSPPKKF